MLTDAGLPLPAADAFTNDTGQLDEAAYANELLDRVASLGQVLSRTGTDRLAAALPLLDLAGRSLGSGPYRLVDIQPGVSLELEAVARSVPPAASDPAHRRSRSWPIRRPRRRSSSRATSTGSSRPTPSRRPPSMPRTGSTPGLRPLPAQWTIVFNTRSGRLYSDARVRRAFDECVDRDQLTDELGGVEAIAATTPLAPGSWAMAADTGTPRDVADAERLLDAAGWVVGQRRHPRA